MVSTRAVGRTLAVLAASSAAAARAADTYDIRPRVAAGSQWTLAVSSSTSVSVGFNGEPPVPRTATGRRTATLTALAVAAGLPTALRVAYGPDCTDTVGQNGQPPQDHPFPLAGRTITVKGGDLGTVQIDGAETAPPTTAEVTALLTPDRSVYPPGPVSVGDEWAGDTGTLARQMGFGPNDTVAVRCKLIRVAPVAGRPAAEIAVTCTGSKTDAGVTTKIAFGGTAQADLATGQILQQDVIGTLAIAGQVSGPGGQAGPVQGDGKFDLHQTLRPAGDPPGLTGGGAVNPPAGGGDTPAAAPAPSPARFAGTFKADRLTVHLDPAAAGGFAGTFAMAGQTFPATAHVDGDRLVGSFVSGGTAFDFAATLDGPTLHLTSGQNRFTLQRDAPPNPLDALGGGRDKPAPVNPLDAR